MSFISQEEQILSSYSHLSLLRQQKHTRLWSNFSEIKGKFTFRWQGCYFRVYLCSGFVWVETWGGREGQSWWCKLSLLWQRHGLHQHLRALEEIINKFLASERDLEKGPGATWPNAERTDLLRSPSQHVCFWKQEKQREKNISCKLAHSCSGFKHTTLRKKQLKHNSHC